MMKRNIALALAISMTASLCMSCGDTGSSGKDTTAADTPAAETTVSTADLIGFEKEDNAGKVFTLLASEEKGYEYDAEEATGDVVSDAVYYKNTAVEDYLGIDLQFVYQSDGWNQRSAFNSTVTNDIMSGDGAYDLVSGITVCNMSLAPEGYLIEGGQLTYCNFDHSWWISDMYKRFSVANKLYGFIGDASLSLYKDMSVIFFNKRIYEEFNAPDMYELVRSGKWTLDKFHEICTGMEKDLNGDGQFDLGTDQINALAECVPNGTWQTTLGLKVVEIDSEGTPQYLGLTEKFISAYDSQRNYWVQPTNKVITSIDDLTYKSMKTFAEGNVATMINFIYSTEYLRDMTDDYGIIPNPKYDESQEKYLAQLGTSTTMFFVPKTTNNVDLTSKVMECMSYYTHELVVPKYYEVALKDKYARDTDIGEMLDIIRDGASFDFLFVYGASCLSSAPNNYFRMMDYGSGVSSTVASDFASKETTFTASLTKLIEKFEAIED